MGNEKTRESKVQVHAWIHEALDARLDRYSKEFEWTKSKIIEDAIACWLNERDMEKK